MRPFVARLRTSARTLGATTVISAPLCSRLWILASATVPAPTTRQRRPSSLRNMGNRFMSVTMAVGLRGQRRSILSALVLGAYELLYGIIHEGQEIHDSHAIDFLDEVDWNKLWFQATFSLVLSGPLSQLFHFFLKRQRDGFRIHLWRKMYRIADAYRDGVAWREMFSRLLEGEESIDAHGDDGQVEPLRQQSDAAAEGAHVAVGCAAAFGEDDD